MGTRYRFDKETAFKASEILYNGYVNNTYTNIWINDCDGEYVNTTERVFNKTRVVH